jgi:NADPH:quinone reductase-like Zn-dependent oxidoreductase
MRVLATTVSSGDWRLRSGELPRGFGVLRGPAVGFGGPRQPVLGTEAAGVVDAVGPGVRTFRPGDRVLAFPGARMGAHAELLIMPAEGRVVPMPEGLSPEEAVALPFGGVTALDFLRRGALRAGERVLVNGAAGSVGVAAVQLARHMGAVVTAVCSAEKGPLLRSLGAEEVIDYRAAGEAGDFTAHGPRYDVVVDVVGTAPYSRAGAALLPGGRLLVVLGDLSSLLWSPFAGRSRGHRVISGPSAEERSDLLEVARLAAEGRLRPVIDQVLPFEQIVVAHRRVESGRKQGSMVLKVQG